MEVSLKDFFLKLGEFVRAVADVAGENAYHRLVLKNTQLYKLSKLSAREARKIFVAAVAELVELGNDDEELIDYIYEIVGMLPYIDLDEELSSLEKQEKAAFWFALGYGKGGEK